MGGPYPQQVLVFLFAREPVGIYGSFEPFFIHFFPGFQPFFIKKKYIKMGILGIGRKIINFLGIGQKIIIFLAQN